MGGRVMERGELHDNMKDAKEELGRKIGSAVGEWEEKHKVWVTSVKYTKNYQILSIETDIKLRMP